MYIVQYRILEFLNKRVAGTRTPTNRRARIPRPFLCPLLRQWPRKGDVCYTYFFPDFLRLPSGKFGGCNAASSPLATKTAVTAGDFIVMERKKQYRRIFPCNLKSVALFLDVSTVCHDPEQESKRQ